LAAFGVWTATAWWSFPVFLVAVALLVYLPGRALLGAPGERPLDELALCLGLGLVAAAAAFRLAALAGHPRWAALLAPAAAAVLIARRRRPWASGPAQGAHAGLITALVLACLPFALVPMYYRNIDRLPGGELTYVPMPDAVLHLAIARGAAVSYPPEVPFVPGRPLRYHHGMDVLSAFFATAGGLDAGDVTVRFLPTLLMALLVLAAFCLGRAWVGSAWAGVAVAVLVPLGEDLSWVPGVLLRPPQEWAVYFLGAPTVSSLYAMNPMLPGAAFLLLALLALLRHSREGGRAWALRAAVLLAAVVDYKVFAAAQALGALAVAAALHAVRLRDRRPGVVLGLAAALALPLAAPAAGGAALVRLDPWPYVPAALERSGLGATWLGLAVPLYLVAVYGLRVLGAPALVRALRPRLGGAAQLTAAVFVLSGPLPALLLAITPATYEPRTRYNEAIWFLVQSKLLAWPFAVEQLFAIARGRRRVLAAGLTLLVAFSLPSAVQYFAVQARVPQTRRLGPEEVALLRFLDGHLPPRTVVLARPQVAEAVLALTRCRAPVFTVHPYYFVPSDELRSHGARLSAFWGAWRAGVLRADIAAAYGAQVVVDEKSAGRAPPPAVRAVYESPAYAVYALPGAAP
jgi:hypothetical protein